MLGISVDAHPAPVADAGTESGNSSREDTYASLADPFVRSVASADQSSDAAQVALVSTVINRFGYEPVGHYCQDLI